MRTGTKTEGYNERIGDYVCAISKGSLTIDTTTQMCKSIMYHATITNYYHQDLFRALYRNTYNSNPSDLNGLKIWYESVIEKLNAEWKTFILGTYFAESNSEQANDEKYSSKNNALD